MRDVVVIGGGLSGLSACYELEKQQIRYTVIEVKRRFGGGIRTSAESGFVMDASAFAFHALADDTLLRELGIHEEVIDIGENAFVFRAGTGTLTDAISRRLTGGRLMRMAVSSLGRWRGRFTVCLENGMMYDAGAIIIAAPARYAARMLFNLAPAAAERLSAYRYDALARLSLGYHKRDLPACIAGSYDKAFPFVLATRAAGRVPDLDHRLIQVGIRGVADLPLDQIVGRVSRHFGWGAPLVSRLDYWAEADPLSCYADDHADNMRLIGAELPPGISLIGSDYCLEAPQVRGVARLDERIRAGRDAARLAVNYLKAKKQR